MGVLQFRSGREAFLGASRWLLAAVCDLGGRAALSGASDSFNEGFGVCRGEPRPQTISFVLDCEEPEMLCFDREYGVSGNRADESVLRISLDNLRKGRKGLTKISSQVNTCLRRVPHGVLHLSCPALTDMNFYEQVVGRNSLVPSEKIMGSPA